MQRTLSTYVRYQERRGKIHRIILDLNFYCHQEVLVRQPKSCKFIINERKGQSSDTEPYEGYAHYNYI